MLQLKILFNFKLLSLDRIIKLFILKHCSIIFFKIQKVETNFKIWKRDYFANFNFWGLIYIIWKFIEINLQILNVLGDQFIKFEKHRNRLAKSKRIVSTNFICHIIFKVTERISIFKSLVCRCYLKFTKFNIDNIIHKLSPFDFFFFQIYQSKIDLHRRI